MSTDNGVYLYCFPPCFAPRGSVPAIIRIVTVTMSTWRRLALELFPEMRRFIQEKDTSYYWVFMDLLPMVVRAHEAEDTSALRRIYRFAEWCFEQRHRAPDLCNAAATAFYEHLVDKPVTLEAIPRWVKPEIFEDMEYEFKRRLDRQGPNRFQELVDRYRDSHHDNVG